LKNKEFVIEVLKRMPMDGSFLGVLESKRDFCIQRLAFIEVAKEFAFAMCNSFDERKEFLNEVIPEISIDDDYENEKRWGWSRYEPPSELFQLIDKEE